MTSGSMVMEVRPVRAALYAMAGMLLVGLTDNAMPAVSEHVGIWQFHYVRSWVALVMLTMWAGWVGLSLKPKNMTGVLGRSALVGTGVFIYFACLGYIPVAEALAGLYTAPLFLLFIAIAQGQRPEPAQIGLTFLGFAGCLLVVQPSFDSLTIETVAPFLAALFYGLGNKTTRTWGRQEHVMVLVGGYLAMLGIWGAVGLLVTDGGDTFMTREWVWPPLYIWLLIFMQAAGVLFAMGLLTKGYQLAAPAFVGAFEYTVLISGGVVGWVAWGHDINFSAAVGIAFILTSAFVLAIRGDSA